MATLLRAFLVFAVAVSSSGPVQPARLAEGSPPPLPLAVCGGEVILEVAVAADGVVRNVRTLRTTPPFTEAVVRAVSRWRFFPAARIEHRVVDGRVSDSLVAVDSMVLVAAIFRPPSINGPTLGEAPRDVAAPTAVPFPTAVVVPAFPPLARDGGLVLLEAALDSTDRIVESRVVRSSPPFDNVALRALAEWRFRSLSRLSYVYVIFGFPQAVLTN